MIVFVDTNVFLDYLLKRHDRKGEDVGEHAFRLFERALGCEFELVISRKVLEEMSHHISFERITSLMLFLKPKLKMASYTAEEAEQAKRMMHPYQDALHVIVACRENAEYIITRNLQDFERFSSLVEPKLPEDV